MNICKLTEAETNLAEIIWQYAPVSSVEIVEICGKTFDWKKSTAYTMVKRLEEKGIFKNTDSVIYALISKEDYYAAQSVEYVENTFSGSLPSFLTAFSRGKKLKQEEILELQKIIDSYKGE